MIDKLSGSGCQEEIRALIEDTVRKKCMEQVLARALMRHESMRPGTPAARVIREARDVP